MKFLVHGLGQHRGRVVNPLYDEIAPWYADWIRTRSWVHPTIAASFTSLLPDIQGKSVLDIGCGEGVFSRMLAERGADVTGMDLSPEMLRHAAPSSPSGITFLQGDAQDMHGIADKCFDGAMCM